MRRASTEDTRNSHEQQVEDCYLLETGSENSNEEEYVYPAENEQIQGLIPQTDNPLAPSLTLRAVFLGTIWCIFLGVINSILGFRTTPFEIPDFLATLMAYPMGVYLARVLPKEFIKIGTNYFPLNPGPFSLKEHILVTIIARSGGKIAYGIDNVVAQKSSLFMGNNDITFLESFLWVLTTQIIGFGMAGLARRFLIKPAAMIWPNILSSIALFVSFHTNETPKGHSISRFNFFVVATIACFAYSFLPQYFFVALQSFNVFCFLSNNRAFNFLASSENGYGIGLGSLTFDWYYIGGAALTTPWWATLNISFANIFWVWFLTPIIYYQLISLEKYPDGTKIGALNTAGLFNSTGNHISPVSLLQETTFQLNETEYLKQAPIYISSFFAMVYASSFLSIIAAFVQVYLWHGSDIYTRFKSALQQIDDKQDTDIHNQLMSAYPDIPEWIFLGFLAFLILFQIFISFFTAFTMPIWAIVLCTIISFASILPIGVITAVSGQRLTLNVLTEFVIGLLLPGETVPVMAFKSLGTNSVVQALVLLEDLKIGHYMKINPVHVVSAQLFGSVLGAFLNTSTAFWIMDSFQSLGTGSWKANQYFIFYNAGAIWGAIGPARFFGIGSVYQSTLWSFLLGILLPFIPWLLNKKFPRSFWKFISIPLLCNVPGPGRYQNYYICLPLVAWYFQSHLKRTNYRWWAKYNYILAIALDTGVGLCVLLIGIIANLNISAPVNALNPDIGNGIPIDYYCLESAYYKG